TTEFECSISFEANSSAECLQTDHGCSFRGLSRIWRMREQKRLSSDARNCLCSSPRNNRLFHYWIPLACWLTLRCVTGFRWVRILLRRTHIDRRMRPLRREDVSLQDRTED